ncbi:GTPase IMAP family member 8-like [Carassius carassius]|uniref:GTPase IMAP family member 8-like n=1 Tax=Carassius carassius TaxID=217509 RepID=UPI00286880B0|nr:GTPase IMAP family member 8-like [Carassius carassius]
MEQEIRAIVLGWQKSDKASVINRILGVEVESDEYFVKSVKREGEVSGRKISLINTPCWWEIFGLQDSPEVVKQELVCSVFLSEPGPHVFLLVINLSLPFTEENRLTIEKHLDLFGESIWGHTIVIFTGADKSIEQHTLNHGLQLIIQSCGGRYHAFETENKSAGVQQLLTKIDDVVAANNGKHYETHDDALLEIKTKREEINEKAKARQKWLQDKRDTLKDIKDESVGPLSTLRIVLLGWILSGKSSAANTIFHNKTFEIEGTKKCTKYSGVVNDRNVTVLDTPGWWKYFAPKFNPKFAQASILESVGQSQQMKFPHAMILVIPIDTSFSSGQKQIIKQYMATLGDDVWRHTIVLFTWGDRCKDISIEQHIESEGEALQWLVEKCRNRYHVFDNTDKKNRDQVTELLQKIDEMVAENSLFSLNTQCAEEENFHETNIQQDEETSLNADKLLTLMFHELKNRSEGIKRKLQELEMDVTRCIEAKSDRSMEYPIALKADEKLMEKIKREGRRWEAILMDGILNIQNPKSSCDENMSVNEKMSWWFQKYEEYSTSETSGYKTEQSDPVEHPQNLEESDNKSDVG